MLNERPAGCPERRCPVDGAPCEGQGTARDCAACGAAPTEIPPNRFDPGAHAAADMVDQLHKAGWQIVDELHKLRVDSMREMILRVERAILAMEQHKEDLVREALLGACGTPGCACPVRTARWVCDSAGARSVERLDLTCDGGHAWSRTFETAVEGDRLVLRVGPPTQEGQP